MASLQPADMRAALLAAKPGRPRRTLLEQHIREQIAQVVRMSPSRIDRDTPFGTLGLDSLMALECRNRLEASLGVTVSATVVWNYPTLAALVPCVAAQMQIPLDAGTANAAPAPVAALSQDSVAEIQSLSEHEAETLLATELAALTGYLDDQLPGKL
jgi:acyl carrier protein